MSHRTRCNYCSLTAIKEEMKQKGKTVTLETKKNGWIAVFVDGKSYGVSFMVLTDHCVC